MTAKPRMATVPVHIPVSDWRTTARATLGAAFSIALFGGALYVLGSLLDKPKRQPSSPDETTTPPLEPRCFTQDTSDDIDETDDVDRDQEVIDEDAERDAAELLGVQLDATIPEIRAAMRARLVETSAHPDHGGSETEAARLIAARDLLVKNAEARREGQGRQNRQDMHG